MILTQSELQNITLIAIETPLQVNHKSLTYFKPILYPTGYVLQQLRKCLIFEERSYKVQSIKTEFCNPFKSLTGNLWFHDFFQLHLVIYTRLTTLKVYFFVLSI